jgi:CubicO group peptidase (beta-lactamase class C family)
LETRSLVKNGIFGVRLIIPISAMRALRFNSLLVVLCCLQTAVFAQLPRIEPESVDISAERLERLDGTLQKYVEDGRLPGAALLVARDGFVVYQRAFGYRDREAGDTLRTDDLFRIASQSKAVVSVGIMILQERGDLLITDALSRYLPEFAHTTVAVPNDAGSYEVEDAKRPITLRHLLTHTAGIGYGGGPAEDRWKAAGITGWYFADRDEPISATVSRMASLPMEAHPGEKWVYGYGTDILGAVIEKVSGMPLDEFLAAEIFEPLGMHDTQFYVSPEEAERLTVVYSVTDDGFERAPDPGHMVGQGMYVRGPRKSFSGGAGIISTAEDYAIFLEMMRRGGELDGVRILSPKTVQLMTVDHLSDVPGNEGRGFGLGFSVRDDLGDSGLPGSIGEFGWGGAYHTTYWVDPAENLVVVYLTQVLPATGLDDASKVRALVYQALVD